MTERDYMLRAIELARKGEGWCHPNPMVGAVIVKDGRIIGEGYHARCGELHAERNAFASLTESAEGATLYVTLEPCCHYGKTPPCTEAIIENKIARVVIGSRDPNPKVCGKGAAILRDAGIQVEEDFMKEECDALNPVFFHYMTSRMPYVTLKYAMTADGKIATKTGASKWITGDAARARVQEMRHAHMAIMAGIGTVLADDPMLNCRLEGGRDPIRVICDSRLQLPFDSQIMQSAREIPTIVVTAMDTHASGEIKVPSSLDMIPADIPLSLCAKALQLLGAGVRIVNLPGRGGKVDLRKLMRFLVEEEIDSVLVEGGGILNESLLKEGLVSEVRAFVAPKIFGGDARSPVAGDGILAVENACIMELYDVEKIEGDVLLSYHVIKQMKPDHEADVASADQSRGEKEEKPYVYGNR
ncbi:MAG: bifunctional diaminohydroxyphosphoribosylaminopyrimidine deaminase/5-amino-6-(5-phosphoribosylamino)uracil reductase RibD [Lachnospiraceae bacterium]|nr:bifunctional diaminohydroxyphosphoribosylaminopyrimidine deaminase/5-amino-6-(5-phosphoribosylamino)uracil reductase RibD [Lachnospiraceae bacterium]